MKLLVFKDKTEVVLNDESNALDCVMTLDSFAEIDGIRSKFTEDNLKGATFDGEELINIVPDTISVNIVNGDVVVHFFNRKKTHDEIIDEQLAELQESMMAMME